VAGQWQEMVLSSADCTELVLGTKGFGFCWCQPDSFLEALNSIKKKVFMACFP